MKNLVLVLSVLFATFVTDAWSQKIHVVTRNIEPFSFEQNGRRVGYAMELWQEVAREAGIDYDVKVVGTAQEMVDALTNKTADAAVGALSVTSKREEIMDFSQPFYESGLQILTSGKTASIADTIFQLVGNLLNWKLVGAFTLLIVVMLVISHLVWLYEHKVNEEMWPKSYRHGLWESFWWTVSTLLVGGADNKGPVGVGGRIVAIIWMLLSIVLVSLLTASFTTTLTVNTLKGDISGPGDLPGRDVATIAGSTAANWLANHGANPKPYATMTECITALKRKEVSAVVYDAPLVQYAVSKDGDDKLQLVDPVFDRQNYAIGLQQDSPLRERINRALLALYESGANTDLQKKWFGSATE